VESSSVHTMNGRASLGGAVSGGAFGGGLLLRSKSLWRGARYPPLVHQVFVAQEIDEILEFLIMNHSILSIGVSGLRSSLFCIQHFPCSVGFWCIMLNNRCGGLKE
jgi:hypothetical protein